MKTISLAALAVLSSILILAQEKPNIIVFLVDDMGLMDTSLPFDVDAEGNPIRHPLNDWYRTPNMERLAAQGIRFSTFYAQSVSSPSRASILTGQNAARHRTTNWIKKEENNRTDFGPYHWNWQGLSPDDQTYPAILKENGYKTIHVGKAHFGCGGSVAENPTVLGFDVNVAGSAIGHSGSYYGENGYGWIKGSRRHAVPGLEQYHGTNTFLTDALTIEACKEIENALNEGKPFYLNLAHYAVHAPFEKDERFIGNYLSGQKGNQAKAFASLVEGMDKSLGDIMEKLNELGVAENTMIIFLGDNGGDAPLGGSFDYGSSVPFKGRKGTEFEGGMRVPFIMSWAKPNAANKFQQAYPIESNSIQTQMGTIMDIYPTILSLAGVVKPKYHELDGSDLKLLVQGKADRKHRDDFLMHFPHKHRGSYFTVYRKGDWKLIYYYNPEKKGKPSWKLYNLSNDPYEKNECAAENPRKVRKLCRLMIERLEAEHACYPVDIQNKTLYPIMLKTN